MRRLFAGAAFAAALVGGGVATAAEPATTPPAAPTPAPAPTQEPPGPGANAALDQLAVACFNGSMQSCDDLYEAARQDPANQAYIAYGDTCAGRQPAGTGVLCARVFLDGPALGQPVPTAAPTTAASPTTAPPAPPTTIAETVMFGVGASTGSVFPACPVGTYLNDPLQCVPTLTPTPPQTVALAVDAVCPVVGDLEHPDPDNPAVFTFTEPAQMRTLAECILPAAVAWMIWEYGSLDLPAEWTASQASSLLPNNFLYVPTGVRGAVTDETCISEDEQGEYAYSDRSLMYCPVDGNVYLGEAQLWSDYNEHGDADLWGSISHEWAHRIQHVAGLPNSATPNEQIPFENQADCFSGAFLDYSARYTALDAPSTGDDLVDLFVGLFNIGDPRIGDPEQNHGSVDQRIRAFFIGYNSPDTQGAWACDFYVTSGSIVPTSTAGHSAPPS
jgi:hypothetical protein